MPTRYVLAIVPFVTRRPQSSGRGWPGLTGGAASIKLSKLLNQEDALGAPCFRTFILLSAGGALRGRIHAADRRNPSLCCHFSVCYTQVIRLASADVSRWVGGRCTGRAHQCKAKQRRRGKTGRRLYLTNTLVGFLDRVEGGKWISLVTITGRYTVAVRQ
jgi:hypothetical protein